jgi:hypothetical protein
MSIWLALFLLFANVDLDIVSVPLSNDLRVPMGQSARADIRREGTVTRVRIDIDKITAPSTLAPVLNTYVVWAISPEGVFDNLGELEVSGTKAQFNGTTRLTQFGLLITAEPHYMVDRPNSAIAFQSQAGQDPRRKTAAIATGSYDYSKLTPISGLGVHSSVLQARTAFQIAMTLNADQLAPQEFRNAQAAVGALNELVARAAPLDILWPTANEAIRWSERAAEVARGKKN